MLTIDGATGEGGGQMLRTSLALSLVTKQPLRMVNIRARRSKPGLMRQHLTAVQAAAAVCGGAVEGAAVGSTEITFRPGTTRGGEYSFSVGTAGSTTLVLQTILPALMLAAEKSSLVLEGGTHNPQSPPFDFLANAYLPIVRRMGPRVEASLDKFGFYPAGGGRFRVTVEPSSKLEAFELLERGAVRSYYARAVVASLPKTIADRELRVIAERLKWEPRWLRAETIDNAEGPGNVVMIELESEQVTEVFTGFGQRGVPAERIADRVASEAIEYLEAAVPVGRHLADQLLLPLALAGGGSFLSLEPSSHTQTQAELIGRCLGIDTRIEPASEHVWHFEIVPK